MRQGSRQQAVRNCKKLKLVLYALCALFFVLCTSAEAQQQGKVFRIGYLDPSNESGNAPLLKAFHQELNKLGWIEGKNIVIEHRFAEQNTERLPEHATELVRLKVDLFVVTGTAPVLAAKSVTASIPIVMIGASGPVAAGLVDSLARPGGNVTGLASLAVELNTKRLEILKDAVPKLSYVGLVRRPGGGVGTGEEVQLKEIRAAASALQLKLEEIASPADAKGLESAFQTAKQKHVNAIMTLTHRAFFAERKRIVELAGKYRLPAICFEKEFMDEGGLMSYGLDYFDLYRRAALYVDKILKGAKPGNLPVEQPKKFELVINLKTAKQLGLTISPNVLARADKVIK